MEEPPAAYSDEEEEETEEEETSSGEEEEDDDEETREPPSKKPESSSSAKKPLFQRVWSEEDEIAVLKGMIEFSTKKGIDPNQDMNGFHDFIKKSLHMDVSRTQLVDKIRRLKKKYENGMKKGEGRTFSKPHEQKSFELSKKVWGRVEVDKFLFDSRFGMPGLEDYVIKNGLNVIGGSKKAELEQRWKKLQIAQLELYIERRDLVREQAMLVLEAFKSSDDK